MRHRGVIKTWNVKRGFGWITWDGEDLFVGSLALPFNVGIGRGAPITFEVENDRQGRPHAVRVQLADGAVS